MVRERIWRFGTRVRLELRGSILVVGTVDEALRIVRLMEIREKMIDALGLKALSACLEILETWPRCQ